MGDTVQTLEWTGGVDGHCRMIDQTRLPVEEAVLDVTTPQDMFDAILRLSVRGAPAIGIAGAYGMVLIAGEEGAPDDPTALLEHLRERGAWLESCRPTAVNLKWGIRRMLDRAEQVTAGGADADAVREALLEEARAIHEEDRRLCHAIGEHGRDLLEDGQGVLTHCNAGGLATSEYGTALAVIRAAHEQGKTLAVYADETRPLLQGARLTTWELMRAGVDTTLICDNMAAQVMKEGRVNAVVTGADRIAANGDVANKIGTYGVALLARAHDVPFYVAAPSSTFDLDCPSGDDIPIEERAADEITEGFGRRTAPEGCKTYSPAFDVTPNELVAAIVTEVGVLRPPYTEAIAEKIAPRHTRS